MRKTNRTGRFAAERWVRKYTRALKPKLVARANKAIDKLYSKGILQDFVDYLKDKYPGWGSRSGVQNAFDPDADKKKFDELVAKSLEGINWKVDPTVKGFTEKIFEASSEHAFGKIGFKGKWNIDSPAFKAALKQRENVIQGVGETQFKALKDSIRTQCYELGGSPVDHKFLEQLQNTAGKASQYEAERIARTEVASVQNTASHTVFKENGVSREEWVSANDDRTRDSHAEMDGETVGIGETFSNGLLYPCDPNGDAEEVINCRCAVAPVFDTGFELDPDEVVTE